jgi:hypothetical protein
MDDAENTMIRFHDLGMDYTFSRRYLTHGEKSLFQNERSNLAIIIKEEALERKKPEIILTPQLCLER